MSKVIPFPGSPELPQIDWDQIEKDRKSEFPKLPKKAINVLRALIEIKSDDIHNYHVAIFDAEDYGTGGFKNTTDIRWILYLLDRLGGVIRCGEKKCEIRRSKPDPPLFVVRRISEGMSRAFNASMGQQYQHYFRAGNWQILGKEIPGVDLMTLLIECTADGEIKYVGLSDMRTAHVLFRRIESRSPVEEVLQLYKD